MLEESEGLAGAEDGVELAGVAEPAGAAGAEAGVAVVGAELAGEAVEPVPGVFGACCGFGVRGVPGLTCAGVVLDGA